MTSKTWPFMNQLNRIVLMQAESGIGGYWEYTAAVNTMDYSIQRNIEENSKTPDGSEPVKLSIQHILGALFLLLFGNIAAIICFLLEIFWHYKARRMLMLKKSLTQWKGYVQREEKKHE